MTPGTETVPEVRAASESSANTVKAVFLDRDGTVLCERGYVRNPEEVELLPGASAAIVRLRRAGWKVVVVTNQGGVAKGMVSEDELDRVHGRMKELLAREGATLDGIYTCPHHPEGTVLQYRVECDCRKPRSGLLRRAAGDLHLDLAKSVIVGDSSRDLVAGRAVGTRAVLVLTGHGSKTAQLDHGADRVSADLSQAVDWILAT